MNRPDDTASVPRRLLSAYRNLWDRRPFGVWAVLLAIFIASVVAFVLTALMLSPWAALAAFVLAAAVFLLRFAPDDDNGGES